MLRHQKVLADVVARDPNVEGLLSRVGGGPLRAGANTGA